MSIALVGSPGPTAHVTAATVTPTFGQGTTSGNLLIACVTAYGGSSAAITSSSSGWVQATQNTALPWAAIWYKLNCGAAEASPVFTSASATAMRAVLSEWSGALTSAALDRTGNSASVSGSTPATILASGPDTNTSDLVVTASAVNIIATATVTYTETWTPSGGSPDLIGSDAATTGTHHFNAAYNLLGGVGGSVADQNVETENTGTITSYTWSIASFLPVVTGTTWQLITPVGALGGYGTAAYGVLPYGGAPAPNVPSAQLAVTCSASITEKEALVASATLGVTAAASIGLRMPLTAAAVLAVVPAAVITTTAMSVSATLAVTVSAAIRWTGASVVAAVLTVAAAAVDIATWQLVAAAVLAVACTAVVTVTALPLLDVYVQAPPGWQPWNIASMWQVSSWDTETTSPVGSVNPPPANTAILAASVAMGAYTLKVWMPLASVQSLG